MDTMHKINPKNGDAKAGGDELKAEGLEFDHLEQLDNLRAHLEALDWFDFMQQLSPHALSLYLEGSDRLTCGLARDLDTVTVEDLQS